MIELKFSPIGFEQHNILFIGNAANGLTWKDHSRFSEKLEKANKTVKTFMDNIASCKGESSCINPLADDHFGNSTASKNRFLKLVGGRTSKTTDITE